MSGGVLDAAVFTAGGRTFTWGDVVNAARAWGEWGRLEASTGRALAVEKKAARAGRLPPAAEVVAATDAFRYERRLISADELAKWLDRWDLGFDELTAYLRRGLLQRDQKDSAVTSGVDGLERASWAAAVCSGQLVSFARRLAEQTALQLAGASEPPTRSEDEAVAEQASTNFISWTRVDCRFLVFADEAPAREAALCVREDGRSIDEVAGDAGLAIEHGRFYIEEAPRALRAHLLAAHPGELTGPVAVDDVFWVLFITGRTPPSFDDAEVVERAQRRAAERALTTALQRSVRWHDRL
jgi:hypothetical protein